MGRSRLDPGYDNRRPWNAGRLVGAKRPFKVKQIWAIRFCLDHEKRLRDRALLDLAIDSKLRGCDLVKLKIGDVVSGGSVKPRAIIVQQKTGNLRAVQILLGHNKIETTVRYLGVDVEDALMLAEGAEI
jgi:site-specific recombinase XerC